MPISSTIDYIPTMDLFLAHWNLANEVQTILLPEGDAAVDRDAFAELRALLDEANTNTQTYLNTLEASRVALTQVRQEAGDRVAEFNRRFRAEFPKDPLLGRLPDVPNRQGARQHFLDAMDDVLDLWARINNRPSTPILATPLLLSGGLTRAQFLALRTEVDGAFAARAGAETEVTVYKGNRNRLQARAHALMAQYRLTIEGRFAPDAVTVETLPRLTPLPGHTPAPVVAQAVWQPAENRAEVTWEASGEADLQDYHIRSVPGPDYTTEDEAVAATIAPSEPRVFHSAAGFGAPGMAVSYKVYTRLRTGNEAGSEAVTVTRP